VANPVIRRNLKVGAEDAEADQTYLENCFVDTGDIGILADVHDPRCVVLGRTGVGKTALLQRLVRETQKSVELAPEKLALSFIANSNVLRFFEEAGVSLDVFYQLLWRHILTVELLKLKFDLKSEARQAEFISSITRIFVRDRAKQKAFDYLREWGDTFWETTEYRTKEFTERLETDLKTSVGIDSTLINAGAEGAKKLTVEQRTEVKQRGMQIVNSVQVKELHHVIEFLADEIFNDEYEKYLIVIDRLDEGWVDDRLRFKLIRTLLEAIKSFKKIRHAKIVVALRTDLHYRMLKEVKNASFQEEKFRSLYLQVRWTREQLVELLNSRVGYLYRRQYTRDRVRLQDVLGSGQMDQRTPIDYILDRTFFRPREAIIYFNECLARAEGQTSITVTIIRDTELSYSRGRLHALADEWRREYPSIEGAAKLLSGRSTPLVLDDILDDECRSFADAFLDHCGHPDDPIYQMTEEFVTNPAAESFGYLAKLCAVLYQVGLLGVKTAPNVGRQWSFDDAPTLDVDVLKPTTQIDVHKTFWAALGVVPRNRSRTGPPRL
jgi:hypothetical protein